MKKFSSFKILFHYLKDEKFKLIIYILLVLFTYLPSLASAYFWGIALERLISKDIFGFATYLAIWEGIYIIFYTVLQIPRDKLLVKIYIERLINYLRNHLKRLGLESLLIDFILILIE